MNTRRRHQHGFSLVELMVGVALTMVISVALLTLLSNVSRNNTEMARTNSVIENGRFTLQLLESDISHSGFWAGFVPTYEDLTVTTSVTATGTGTVAFPSTVPDPCPYVTTPSTQWSQPSAWTDDYKGQLVALPVQVYKYGASGTAPPVCAGISSLQGPLYSSTNTLVQPYTDILVVRHAAPCPATASAIDDDCKSTTGNLFFQTSRCNTDGRTWVLSATAADLVLKTGNCTAVASTYRYMSTIYWVRNYLTTAGDGIPTLVRSRYQLSGGVLKHTGTETLVDGIEGFRVQLGVDATSKPVTSGGSGNALSAASYAAAPAFAVTTNTYTPTNRGDGNADAYITCATGTGSSACYDSTNATTLGQSAFNLANTVAVKLYVLARATTATPGYTDSKVYCLGGSCGAPTVTSCPTGSFNDRLTLFGPYCDSFKRHVYTQTIRMNNISMRREVPNSW